MSADVVKGGLNKIRSKNMAAKVKKIILEGGPGDHDFRRQQQQQQQQPSKMKKTVLR